MQESINLGIPTYWSSPEFILNTNTPNCIRVVLVKENAQNFPMDWIEVMPSIFQHLHYRIDPPIDATYLSLIQQLLERGFNEDQIKSPPQILKYQSEKIPPLALKAFTPKIQVIDADIQLSHTQLSIIQHEFASDPFVVTKPLNLAQSLGVKKFPTPKSESEWKQLITAETEQFTKGLLIQEYLPEVNEGEVRLWFAGGEFIGSLKKYPKKNDFRVLIDEGSKVEAYVLSESESLTAQKIGAVLKEQGVALAAIDLIGGKISDYNISSPGLLVQLEAVHGGKNFAKIILEKLYLL